MRAYLTGSGIASLAAAAYLVRDGGVLPANITVFEAGDHIGGAMAAFGDPSHGYVLPAGRIFESEFRCAHELFSMVPSAIDPHVSVWDEVVRFNERYGYLAKVRIIDRHGAKALERHLGLRPQDRLDLVRLALMPEASLDGRRIDEFCQPDFFASDFWMLWTSTMNALPQHSAAEFNRFLHRFLHLFADLPAMTKVWRAPIDQREAFVQPVADWLRRQGVAFMCGSMVTDIGFQPTRERITANSLTVTGADGTRTIDIAPDDVVLVTAGSQATDLSIGSMDAAPERHRERRSVSLWQSLARGRPEFGRPDVFFGETKVSDTIWMTFTVTTRDPTFFRLYEELTGAEAGRGGVQILKDSAWLLNIALLHTPKFLGQPPNVMVWYGFAILPARTGEHVRKPMTECSGREILKEVLCVLRFDADAETIIANSTCIPCLLPHAGSVWLARRAGDRPAVVPEGATNFGFIGQFAEVAKEASYTMEYSIRSAREAVAILRRTGRPPAPVYQGQRDVHALSDALGALL